MSALRQRSDQSGPGEVHIGKAKGAVLRVQADRSDLSRLAGGAAVSYAGHIPMVQCGFGVSPWRPDDDAYEA